MSSLLKTIVGLLIVLVVASYIIDSRPVSTSLQTGRNSVDPLVAGARTVKQEVRTLTDPARLESYKQALKDGINKAVNKLNDISTKKDQLLQPETKTSPKNNDNSL